MLLINKLEFKRLNTVIFSDINISLNPGKILFIKGTNGSGKTTLLKTILNILNPTDGEIYWMSKNIKKNIFKFYNNVTFIMDKPTAIKEMTLIENINIWKKFSNSKINDEEINNLIKILNLEKYLNKQVNNLSLGEIKKLELSRLIIEQKKLWFLDEPFSHLDKISLDLIVQTFIDHTNNNGSIIFSSHLDPDIKNIETLNLS
ncbi:MAG: heme ABC exporter ATP-binding protein CcmA [Pelagibacteraceae bacterium]|nr:heme ABC exporter ATP-binding protein CcmA [Pelagibacteraceae bacterium]|tara:strand:- start:38217 stop:38825 length:609 start_codon:yes stop_codon:yes gene_type:complete